MMGLILSNFDILYEIDPFLKSASMTLVLDSGWSPYILILLFSPTIPSYMHGWWNTGWSFCLHVIMAHGKTGQSHRLYVCIEEGPIEQWWWQQYICMMGICWHFVQIFLLSLYYYSRIHGCSPFIKHVEIVKDFGKPYCNSEILISCMDYVWQTYGWTLIKNCGHQTNWTKTTSKRSVKATKSNHKI